MFGKSLGRAAAAVVAGVLALASVPSLAGDDMPALGVPGYGYGGGMPAVGMPFNLHTLGMPFNLHTLGMPFNLHTLGMPFNLHTLGMPGMASMAPGGAMVVWIPAVVSIPAAMPYAPPVGTAGAAQPVLCALDPSNPAAGVPAGQKVVVITDTEMACHAINGEIANPAATGTP